MVKKSLDTKIISCGSSNRAVPLLQSDRKPTSKYSRSMGVV